MDRHEKSDGIVFHSGTLFRQDLAIRLATIPTTILSDSMERLSEHVAVGLKLLSRPRVTSFVGRAATVRTTPGDNLMIHAALDLALPGDVLVVDGGGDLTRAVIGEIVVRYAIRRGLAGLVIDGATRDLAYLHESPLPVYARGNSLLGPHKRGWGDIGGTVSVGGATVHADDYVVGDQDGVVIVPRDDAERVLEKATCGVELEASMLAAIERDNLDRSWIRESLSIRDVSI